MSAAVTGQTTTSESTTHGRSMGWYGMVFFLASEAVFFANMIAGYLYLFVRAGSNWQKPELDITLPAINTLILLSSSFPMHFAGRAAIRGDKRALTLNLGLTVLLGSIFLGGQAWEYAHNVFGPSDGIFGSTFYMLTGFHGAHVTAGVLFLLVCFLRANAGHFTKERHFAVQAAEMYWHFVDGVWVLLFTVLYVVNVFFVTNTR